MRHYLSDNKPALGEAFKLEETKEFLFELLEELSDANTLKHFLRVGHEEYYNELIKEVSKHFRVLEHDPNKSHLHRAAYLKVKRCIDGQIFSVGDKVLDMSTSTLHSVPIRSFPIGLMYEGDNGLVIRLDVEPEGKSVTWRNLSDIDHDLPF